MLHSSSRQESPIVASFDARSFVDKDGNPRPFKLDRDYSMDELPKLLPMLGVGFDAPSAMTMQEYAMDANTGIQQAQSAGYAGTPVQFLQNWLPGFVLYITAARKIDELIGMDVLGSWEDEEIVQQFIELTGAAAPYGDTTNMPLTNWNPNFLTRTVVNFELGMQVNIKEEARVARMRISTGDQKRMSITQNLEVSRNAIGFYGYNSGTNSTYGFLNDTNLPAYVSAPNGNWASSTFAHIQQDLLTALQALRTNSQDTIDPGKTPLTLAIATKVRDYLSTTTDFGISVMDWLKTTYPNVRVTSAPQLNAANSGSNVFYLYADRVDDMGSTDGGKTFMQVVPAKMQLLGVQKLVKGYLEGYTNATAGVFCKRGYAVVRYTGI